jgi:hypothetical protein
MKTAKPSFTITLEALPDDLRPPEIRLRQLLKIALRGMRLRCVGLAEVGGERIPNDLEMK